MNVLLARPTSVSRRHKALKSAASALAMLAVGGVLSPALAEDWYWVGGNAGDLQDEANWAVGSRAGGNPDYLWAA